LADEKDKNEKTSSPEKIKLSGKKPTKKTIDLNPMIPHVKGEIRESRDLDRIDQLIRAGLGDMGRVSFYRRAIHSPDQAVRNVQLREYVGTVLDRLVEIILNDPTLFNRVKLTLMHRGKGLAEDHVEDVIQAALRLRQNHK
jgi:hypothetical protein